MECEYLLDYHYHKPQQLVQKVFDNSCLYKQIQWFMYTFCESTR